MLPTAMISDSHEQSGPLNMKLRERNKNQKIVQYWGKKKVCLYPVIHGADSTLPFLWVSYGNVINWMKDNNPINFMW